MAGNTFGLWSGTIAEDSQGNMWFGTRDSGISIIDPLTLQIKSLDINLKDITVILEDRNETIYIGTSENGIWSYNRLSESITQLKLP